MLLREALEWATDTLAKSGVASPSVDAELLAAHVMELSRSELTLKSLENFELGSAEQAAFQSFVHSRSERIPLQHLTGLAAFRSIELEVGAGVFIPRPETEVVVGHALELLAKFPNPKVVDFCSGSGAIAISIATEVEGAQVIAVEKSPAAYSFLVRNFEKYGLDVANAMLGEIDSALLDRPGFFDMVIANPPYIPISAVPVDLEVQLHEPRLALYGGEDGLDLIRALSRRARELVRPGGAIVLEHADIQGPAVVELLLADGWGSVQSLKDLNGKDRMVSARLP